MQKTPCRVALGRTLRWLEERTPLRLLSREPALTEAELAEIRGIILDELGREPTSEERESIEAGILDGIERRRPRW
jgi:hypothetical protein